VVELAGSSIAALGQMILTELEGHEGEFRVEEAAAVAGAAAVAPIEADVKMGDQNHRRRIDGGGGVQKLAALSACTVVMKILATYVTSGHEEHVNGRP